MTKSFTKGAHTTKWIPVKDLSVVWADAQRDLNERRASEIAAKFDPALFDDLVVCIPNGDDKYHVVDGQTRRAAIQELWGEDEKVPCRIVEASTPAEAAKIFVDINTSRKDPSAVEKFNVRVTAGEKTEVEINKIITYLGYRVAGYKSENTIPAVKSLLHIYKTFGADVLKETLMTIKGTWAADENAVNGNLLTGYAAFIGEHRNHLDWQRLREAVAKNYTPGRLLGTAKYHKEMAEITITEAVKHVLTNAYNKGLRKGQL